MPPHVDTVDQSGKTPLHWAVIESQKEAVNLLLHWGANHELLDNQSRSALHFAAEVGTWWTWFGGEDSGKTWEKGTSASMGNMGWGGNIAWFFGHAWVC